MSENGIDRRRHLTEELAAAWLDGELVGEERARVASHLADCEVCRGELAAVRGLLGADGATDDRAAGDDAAAMRPAEPPVRSRGLLRYLVPAAAAAAAIWLLVVPTGGEREPRLRSGPGREAGGVAAVVTVMPVDDRIVEAEPVFTWRAAGPDAHYTLTLSDAAGALVWQTSTADTSVVLPADISLANGRTWFWTVDALLADGETASSGLQGFRTAP